MRLHTIIVISLIALAIIAYFQISPATGSLDPGDKIVALTKRVEKLETAVRFLATELDKIKQQVSETQLTESTLSLQKLAIIRKVLVEGASKETIRQVLGEPIRSEKLSSFEYWYYPNDRKLKFWNGKLDGWEGF